MIPHPRINPPRIGPAELHVVEGATLIPEPETPQDETADEQGDQWSPSGPGVPPSGPPAPFGTGGDKPFLPSQPPVEIGGQSSEPAPPGPWGLPRRN